MTSPNQRAFPMEDDDAPTGGEPRVPTEEELSEALLAEARQPPMATPPRRFAHIPEARLANPSRMARHPGLLARLLWGLTFRRVAFDERHQRAIRDAHREGDVVFVMNHHSLLDYSYFNYAFLRFGLPLVYFANNLAMTVFRPLWRLAWDGLRRLFDRRRVVLSETDRLAYALETGRPALLFLKRRGLWPWSPDQPANEYLETLVRAQLARIEACDAARGERPRPILLVPQLLVWSHNPDRYRRSLRDVVFGNPEAPGRVRKALNFLINRRRAFVQVGRTVDLLEVIAEQAAGLGPEELARKLRFQLLQALSTEERVIKGPILKDARQLRQEILRTGEMQAEIRRLAREAGRSPEDLQKTVERYLKEMSADFSMAYIEMMCIALTLVFDRLYSEVVTDQEGLERVREAGRNAPLVLLPCHRSHVDYLVISYLFYAHGLIPPHIAAGANLNFFPIGHIFRRSGAFFLRRSFRDNEAYRITFREYLTKLVREGYWIEFFPEGGRSRTGKMLPPRFGMLSIILDAIRHGAAPDVHLVPVYVGYEQVIEERAYTKELSGGEKKSESITGLLKTTKVLWSRYGRLYVSFAEPLSVRAMLEEAGAMELDTEDPTYQRTLRRIAYRVHDGIQHAALVTPSALTSLTLLIHPKRGVRREVLLRRIGFLLELAGQKHATLSKTLEHALKIRRQEVAAAIEQRDREGLPAAPLALGEASPVALARGEAVAEAIDEVLQRYVKEKHIEVRTFDDEADTVYVPVPDKRINLDFYKNNIVHLLVPEAILAAAIAGTQQDGRTRESVVREASRFLSFTFKFEFVYDPDVPFDEEHDGVLGRFEEAGLVRREDGDLVVPAEGPEGETLALLHQVLEPWLEAYWLMAEGLRDQVVGEVPEKDFLRKLQRTSERRFHEGELVCPEAASSVTFRHALDAFEEMGYVARRRKGREKVLARPAGADALDPLPELAGRLKGFIRA